MKKKFPVLFVCCLPLLCAAQNKKLPLYEYGVDLLPAYHLHGADTFADYTQITLQPGHKGEMDTTAVLRVRFDGGRILSADKYEYEPGDDAPKGPFGEKNRKKNGRRTAYVYDGGGHVTGVNNFRIVAAGSKEGAELVMNITLDSLQAHLPAEFDQRHTKGEVDFQVEWRKRQEQLVKTLQQTHTNQKIIPLGAELYRYNQDGNPLLSYDTVWNDTNYYSYSYYPDGFVNTQHVISQRDTLTVITERVFAYDQQHRITSIHSYRKKYNRRPVRAADTASIAGEYELQNWELMQYGDDGRPAIRTLLGRTQAGIDTTGRAVYTYYGKDSVEQTLIAYYYGGGKRAKRILACYNKAGLPTEIRKYEPAENPGKEQLVQHDLILYGQPDISEPTEMRNGQPVYTYITELPKFRAEVHRYVTRKMKYPASVTKMEGKVIVQFAVTREGDIEEAKIVQGMHPDIDKEVLRIVNRMRNWQPGKRNGRPVRMYYTLSVHVAK